MLNCVSAYFYRQNSQGEEPLILDVKEIFGRQFYLRGVRSIENCAQALNNETPRIPNSSISTGEKKILIIHPKDKDRARTAFIKAGLLRDNLA